MNLPGFTAENATHRTPLHAFTLLSGSIDQVDDVITPMFFCELKYYGWAAWAGTYYCTPLAAIATAVSGLGGIAVGSLCLSAFSSFGRKLADKEC